MFIRKLGNLVWRSIEREQSSAAALSPHSRFRLLALSYLVP